MIFSHHRFPVTLLASCGSPTPTPPAVTPGPAFIIRGSSEMSLQLTAYLLTVDQMELEQRGLCQRQVTCSARYGGDDHPGGSGSRSPEIRARRSEKGPRTGKGGFEVTFSRSAIPAIGPRP